MTLFIKIQFRETGTIEDAIASTYLKPGVIDFIVSTFKIIKTGKVHMIASAFAFSRETLIPEMFLEILNQVDIL